MQVTIEINRDKVPLGISIAGGSDTRVVSAYWVKFIPTEATVSVVEWVGPEDPGSNPVEIGIVSTFCEKWESKKIWYWRKKTSFINYWRSLSFLSVHSPCWLMRILFQFHTENLINWLWVSFEIQAALFSKFWEMWGGLLRNEALGTKRF